MLYHVYTDGACSGNRRGGNCVGGFGFVIVDPKNDSMIDRNGKSEIGTTNNRMEMTGVIAGINALKEHLKLINEEPSKTQCHIITDSQYVCDNWNDYIETWKSNGWRKSSGKPVLNRDLWMAIDSISSEFESVEFKWVKGHADNPYNTMADEIACAEIRKIKCSS